MSDQPYTAAELEELSLEDLREVQVTLGLVPGEKQERRLREEILAEQERLAAEAAGSNAPAGEGTKPDDSEVKPDPVDPAKPTQAAEVFPSLAVNKYSSRLELESAALTLGIEEKKIREVAQLEDLWRLVKNAYLAKNTAVSVEEETGEGELMKQNVKHKGTNYEKGKRYTLDEETKQEFFKLFYI